MDKFIIIYSQLLSDAMKQMDHHGINCLVVIDDDCNLVGTLSNGDVRRFILQGGSVDEYVTRAVNLNPISIDKNRKRAFGASFDRLGDLQVIPIVDGSRVVDVVFPQKLNSYLQQPAAALIMCGGFGTRLHPLTLDCPKPLLNLGKLTILEYIIQTLSLHGFRDIYISTHFLPHLIEQKIGDGSKYNVNVKYVYENQPLGTGGAVALLSEELSYDDLLVINGDIMTELDFAKFLSYHLKKNSYFTFFGKIHNYHVPYGVVSTSENGELEITEKPTFQHLINSGVYILNSKLIKRIPKDQFYNLPDAINLLNQQFEVAACYQDNAYWLDIGSHESYKKAQKEIKTLTSYKKIIKSIR